MNGSTKSIKNDSAHLESADLREDIPIILEGAISSDPKSSVSILISGPPQPNQNMPLIFQVVTLRHDVSNFVVVR